MNRASALMRNPIDILKLTYRQMRDADVDLLASSLAFATVLSLIPLLAVSLSVFTAYGGLESLMKRVEPFILQNLVEASGAQLSRAIRMAIDRVQSGVLGVGGALGLLMASTKLFHDMEQAVQRVWRVKSQRRWYTRFGSYWLVMFLSPLVIAALLGLVGSKDLGLFAVLPKGIVALVCAFIALTSIYKLVPATPVAMRSALTASAFATLALVVAHTSYAEITRKFLSYNQVYGSLASFPIFLLWILLLWWICLAGVALTAVLESRRQS